MTNEEQRRDFWCKLYMQGIDRMTVSTESFCAAMDYADLVLAEYDKRFGEAKSDEAGWIEWGGGECPVDDGVMVDVVFENGEQSNASDAWGWLWSERGPEGIVKYRVAGE